MRLGDGGFISTGEYVCLYLNATVFIIVLFLFNFFLIVIVTTNDIVIVSVIVSGDTYLLVNIVSPHPAPHQIQPRCLYIANMFIKC